jgi:hypothetical protein
MHRTVEASPEVALAEIFALEAHKVAHSHAKRDELNKPRTASGCSDGMIDLPLINQVTASGKTAAQLEAELTRLYSTNTSTSTWSPGPMT